MNRQPIRVQVMEAAISWPERCACCNGPADMRFTGVHAREPSDAPAPEWEVP